MSKRTKEALIAQQQALHKSQGGKVSEFNFSFAKFPSARAFQYAVVFGLLGVVLIGLPVLLPDLGKDLFRNRAISSVSQFELTNEVFKGQFKRSARSSDTTPDSDATFMGVSILGDSLQHAQDTQSYINQLEANYFNNNTEQIFQGVVQLKALGILNEGNVWQQYADKYYSILLGLTERHSAFRLNSERSASVGATYYAFGAIRELGKMEQFSKQEEFNSAIHFVASMKDSQSGGFSDVSGQNATILATWQAVHILGEQKRKTELVAKALEGTERFVFSCQLKDGGFTDSPVSEESFATRSKISTTDQALYILEFLKENGLTFSVSDPAWNSYYEANNYMRAGLSLRHGVLGHYPSDKPDLEASYYFLQLVKDFPSVVYGTPRWLQLLFVGAGLVFLLVALYYFYSSQIPRGTTGGMKSELVRSFVFLSFGAVALQLCPQAAIAIYLIFATYLAIQFWEVQSTDSTDNYMVLTAGSNTALYMGLVVGLTFATESPFVHFQTYYALAFWGAFVTIGTTIGACYVTGQKKIFFYVNSSYLAWILNTVIFYGYLYGHGELDVAFRLIVVHGHFPLVFVILPLISHGLAYGLSAATAAAFLTYTKEAPVEKKGAKEEKEEEETEEDTLAPQ